MRKLKVILVGGPDDGLVVEIPEDKFRHRTENCKGTTLYVIADFMVDDEDFYFGIHNSLTILEGMTKVFNSYVKKGKLR